MIELTLDYNSSNFDLVYLMKKTDKEITENKKSQLYLAGFVTWHPVGESNPCYRRERAVS